MIKWKRINSYLLVWLARAELQIHFEDHSLCLAVTFWICRSQLEYLARIDCKLHSSGDDGETVGSGVRRKEVHPSNSQGAKMCVEEHQKQGPKRKRREAFWSGMSHSVGIGRWVGGISRVIKLGRVAGFHRWLEGGHDDLCLPLLLDLGFLTAVPQRNHILPWNRMKWNKKSIPSELNTPQDVL